MKFFTVKRVSLCVAYRKSCNIEAFKSFLAITFEACRIFLVRLKTITYHFTSLLVDLIAHLTSVNIQEGKSYQRSNFTVISYA